MKILYAPWRSEYSSKVGKGKKEETTEGECVFCQQFHENQDEENFILKRFKNTVVMLNRYPYNAGHLLILPKKHVGNLNQLSKAERAELMEIFNKSIEILGSTLKNEGLNLGLSLGKVAGAGVPSHLHFHILPRWQGDTNFMPTLAKTKIISFDLGKIYKELKKQFDEVK